MLKKGYIVQRAKIESIKFLTADQCRIAQSAIYHLKDLWQPHDHNTARATNAIPHPFYTLGVPSYLGAANHEKETNYYNKAKTLNPMMMKEFRWLYEDISAALSNVLGKNVCFTQKLALPGFHIFPTRRGVQYPCVGMHLDLQYKLHNWDSSNEIDFKNPISFTVPISLSENGGGLNVCDRPVGQMMFMNDKERQLVFDQETRYIPYHLGELIIHQGLWFHEVAERRNEQSETDRITLQGHGLFGANSWTLYW